MKRIDWDRVTKELAGEHKRERQLDERDLEQAAHEALEKLHNKDKYYKVYKREDEQTAAEKLDKELNDAWRTAHKIIRDIENENEAKTPVDQAMDSLSDEHFEFKFNEDKLINNLYDYIVSTYSSHYSGEKYQATDLIIDAGHGTGFCIGNIIKYAKRYGKKDGYNDDDIKKILHYALIMWYIHRKENRDD